MPVPDILEGSQHRYGVTHPVLSTPIQGIPATAVGAQLTDMLEARIANNVQRLREERNWSRPELGKRCRPATSGQQIERLEKCQRRLTISWIERLAGALGVDPAELIAEESGSYALDERVADEVAVHLARFVLRGAEPHPEIVQGLSILILGLSETFVQHPQARRDPLAARLAVDLLSRLHAEPNA